MQKNSLKDVLENARTKWALEHVRLGLYVTAVGLLLSIMVGLWHKLNPTFFSEYLWSAILSIPVTFICLGGFSVFYEWFIRHRFTKAMRSLNNAYETGVFVLASHKDAPNRVEILSGAKKTVKIMSTTLTRYFNEVRTDVEEKAKQGIDFKFIIYEPYSPGVQEKAFEEDKAADFFNSEIMSTCWLNIRPLLQKYSNHVKVKFCPFNVPFAVTVIDDTKMVLSLNIYGLVRSKFQTPCLIIDNKYDSDSVFKQYDESFDAIWRKLPDDYPEIVKPCFDFSQTPQ